MQDSTANSSDRRILRQGVGADVRQCQASPHREHIVDNAQIYVAGLAQRKRLWRFSVSLEKHCSKKSAKNYLHNQKISDDLYEICGHMFN